MTIKYRKLVRKFHSLFSFALSGHKRYASGGHSIYHDKTVAQFALVIAPTPRLGEMAWVAAFLHSMDYWAAQEKTSFDSMLSNAMVYLPRNYFSEKEEVSIFQAALRHSEKNSDDQDMTQQVLQDADRLANLMSTVIFRIGQQHPFLTPVEFYYVKTRNPNSRYLSPCSCLDVLRFIIDEYEPQFRLPKAKKIARAQIMRLKKVISFIEAEHEEIGFD